LKDFSVLVHFHYILIGQDFDVYMPANSAGMAPGGHFNFTETPDITTLLRQENL